MAQAFKQKVNRDLTHALSKSIVKLGWSVEMAPDKASPYSLQPAWLIQGRYVRVYQGSRALRSFIGFGAGGTKMETVVEVYDLSVSGRVPAFTFETTGGSGAEPGGLLAPNPIGVGIATAGKTGKGLSDDTKRIRFRRLSRTSNLGLVEVLRELHRVHPCSAQVALGFNEGK